MIGRLSFWAALAGVAAAFGAFEENQTENLTENLTENQTENLTENLTENQTDYKYAKWKSLLTTTTTTVSLIYPNELAISIEEAVLGRAGQLTGVEPFRSGPSTAADHIPGAKVAALALLKFDEDDPSESLRESFMLYAHPTNYATQNGIYAAGVSIEVPVKVVQENGNEIIALVAIWENETVERTMFNNSDGISVFNYLQVQLYRNTSEGLERITRTSYPVKLRMNRWPVQEGSVCVVYYPEERFWASAGVDTATDPSGKFFCESTSFDPNAVFAGVLRDDVLEQAEQLCEDLEVLTYTAFEKILDTGSWSSSWKMYPLYVAVLAAAVFVAVGLHVDSQFLNDRNMMAFLVDKTLRRAQAVPASALGKPASDHHFLSPLTVGLAQDSEKSTPLWVELVALWCDSHIVKTVFHHTSPAFATFDRFGKRIRFVGLMVIMDKIISHKVCIQNFDGSMIRDPAMRRVFESMQSAFLQECLDNYDKCCGEEFRSFTQKASFWEKLVLLNMVCHPAVVFTRFSIFVHNTTKALWYANKLLVTLALSASFFYATGAKRPLPENYPLHHFPQLEGDDPCAPVEHSLPYQVIQSSVVYVVCLLAATVFNLLLVLSLTRRWVYRERWKQDHKLIVQAMLKAKEGVIIALGMLVCLFSATFTFVFLANVSEVDRLKWFLAASPCVAIMLFVGPVSEAALALIFSEQIIHGDPGLIRQLRNVYCGNQYQIDEEAKETQTYCEQILQPIAEPASPDSAADDVEEDTSKSPGDRHKDFMVKMASLDFIDDDQRELERHARLMAYVDKSKPETSL